MPFLKVYTNTGLKDNNATQFVERAAELVATELGKPIGYVVVSLTENPAMSFGGSADNKGALAYLESVGFGNNKTKLAKLLTEFLFERLKDAELGNINVVMTNLAASDVAVGGHLLG